MKNKILIPFVIVGALAAFFSFKYGSTPRSSEERRKLVVETVMRTIDAAHFSPRTLDDTFSVRAYNKIVHDFDYDKLYFTQQDINKLKQYQYKIDDEIRARSIEFFDTFDAVFTRRIASVEKFYPEILQKQMSFTGNEEIQLNGDREEYAANETELRHRWDQYLKYRVLVQFIDLKNEQDKKKENKDSVNVKFKTDGELEAQARDDIKKNYDRYFKRFHKVKDDDRFTLYVNSITEAEDPHTSYFPPLEKKAFDEQMSGSFFGIGAKLSPANDKITVSEIIPGSPSWKQGELKAGDEIIKVAQGKATPVDVQGYELDDAVQLIRGPKGTEVRLTVKRPDGTVKVISIIRDVIQKEEVFAKSAIIKSNDGPIGYIYLPEFYADFNHTSGRACAADVAEEVKKLKQAGVSGIILDLRGNGGGSLGDVVDMAGIFLGKGPVVQVKSNHASPTVLKAQGNETPQYSGPLAIMVDGGSASASEILAAALQDYKRAVIVGSLTYGKGTVQKMIPLDDMVDVVSKLQMINDTEGAMGKSLGSLKITMEKFYRVNGGSTQLKGVTPDISLPDIYEAYDDEELGERHRKSALPWDVVPAATYKPANTIVNLQQLVTMSQGRVQSSPAFKQVQENSDYLKKKKQDNRVSLNEKQYKKDQEEANTYSKKLDEMLKKSASLDVSNPAADMERINMDTLTVTRNKEWLKRLSNDMYVSETINIISDMIHSGMKVDIGTGMK